MLCIDLFCGLGGWTEGFLAEGWDCIGFDIERHVYGWRKCPECGGTGNFYRYDEDGDYLPCDCVEEYGTAFTQNEGKIPNRYPAQLVLQDVLTLHGSQFRDADCIVASPPCQEFSYMAMPWSRAKQIAAALQGKGDFPDGYSGSRTVADLTALFGACFRIQREACEAATMAYGCARCGLYHPATKLDGCEFTPRYIPMVVENVKGAQRWVGKAKANFGSFYFWGDVAMVGGRVVAGRPQFGDFTRAAKRGMKRNPDGGRRTDVGKGARFTSRDCGDERKQPVWFNDDKHRKCGGDGFGSGSDCSLMRSMSSKSSARKAASAQIAKIPYALSSYIARAFKPGEPRGTHRKSACGQCRARA